MLQPVFVAIHHQHMRSSSADLHSIVDALPKLKIVVVGDVMLDRYLWGDVERISPEAPVPVVDVKRAHDRLGGAANVANNLAALGVHVELIGVVGNDEEAQGLRSILKQSKIGARDVFVSPLRCTTVKTRIVAGVQQIVRIDHENRDHLSHDLEQKVEKALLKALRTADAVIVSDYGKGVITAGLLKRLGDEQKKKRLGLKVNKPCVVDPHPRNYALYKSLGVAKPNRKEAEAATGIHIVDRVTAGKAAEALTKLWGCDLIVLSLGEGGLCLAERGVSKKVFLDTVAQEVFDVSGAGDAVVSVIAAALAAGATPLLAGELANIAAGVVVSEVGTVPVNKSKLLTEIDRLGKPSNG